MEDIYKKVADHLTAREKPAPEELKTKEVHRIEDLGKTKLAELEGHLRRERALVMDNSELQIFLQAEFGDQLEDESAIKSAIRLLKESKELPVSSDWMETQSGIKFEPLGEDPQYKLADLVWGCARLCRYAGQISHVHGHYSVAEHLVLGTRWLMTTDDPEVQALMPDAPEACRQVIRTQVAHDLQEGLIGDMVRPMKRQDPIYRRIEDRLCAHLAKRYDLIFPLPQVVKMLDNRILVDERKQALAPSGHRWVTDDLKPLGIKLQFWSAQYAAYKLFELLTELGFDIHE